MRDFLKIADVWVSMGEDAERERRLRDLRPCQVSEEVTAASRR